MSNDKTTQDVEGRDLNRDPISGAPGSHPVGVAAGGVVGGAAAGALAGTLLGPIGTLVGAAVGVVVGAAAGKGVAERVDPTGETEYWRDAHTSRPYYDDKYEYERDYSPAYGFGLQAREADGARRWDEAEADLKQGWLGSRDDSRLEWDDARGPVKDAWLRADRTHDTYARADGYHGDRFEKAEYREADTSFDEYRPAYRYGAQARTRYQDREWDAELEQALGRDWDQRRGGSSLSWERAKDAVRDAFTSHDEYNRNLDDNPLENEHFNVR